MPAQKAIIACHMSDRDLMEAWLLIPTDDVLSAFDHEVADEIGRRAISSGNYPHPQDQASRRRLFRFE